MASAVLFLGVLLDVAACTLTAMQRFCRIRAFLKKICEVLALLKRRRRYWPGTNASVRPATSSLFTLLAAPSGPSVSECSVYRNYDFPQPCRVSCEGLVIMHSL